MERDRKYTANVGDILLYPFKYGEEIYRVIGIRLGGERQASVVELEPVGLAPPEAPGVYIPAMILDQTVRLGVVECVWRKPEVVFAGVGGGSVPLRNPCSRCQDTGHLVTVRRDDGVVTHCPDCKPAEPGRGEVG